MGSKTGPSDAIMDHTKRNRRYEKGEGPMNMEYVLEQLKNLLAIDSVRLYKRGDGLSFK